MACSAYEDLQTSCDMPADKARLKAAKAPHAGDWLNAPPLKAIGLRLSDEAIRVTVGLMLGCITCQPHVCIFGAMVDARGLHCLSCRKSGPIHIRHSHINDLIWRAVKRAQIPATREPTGLSRSDGKRSDGASLIPWKRGKPLAWDVTVPDTYAASHIGETAENAGAAAKKAATNKIVKYNSLATTLNFIPIAIETTSPWNSEASEFIAELGKKITEVTLEPLQTQYLFQRLSIALQRGNVIAFRNTFITE